MPYISEKPPSSYPFVARIIFWAQKKKYGQTLGPAKLWARSPWLLYGVQFLYRCLDRKQNPLESSLRSLVSAKVAEINHCDFCSDIGRALLRKRGVKLEKIDKIVDFSQSSLFTPRETAALKFAETVSRAQKGELSQALMDLKKHFSEDEIVELTGWICYQNMASKFNFALGVEAQGFCALPKS